MRASDVEKQLMESEARLEMLAQATKRIEELKGKIAFLRSTLGNSGESFNLDEFMAIEAEIDATHEEINTIESMRV